MENDFSKECCGHEECSGCIDCAIEDYFDQYDLLLTLHDRPIRDEELRKMGVLPYCMTRLKTMPFNPDVSVLLYINQKREAIEKAKKLVDADLVATATDVAPEDAELAEIRKKKAQKLMGGK